MYPQSFADRHDEVVGRFARGLAELEDPIEQWRERARHHERLSEPPAAPSPMRRLMRGLWGLGLSVALAGGVAALVEVLHK